MGGSTGGGGGGGGVGARVAAWLGARGVARGEERIVLVVGLQRAGRGAVLRALRPDATGVFSAAGVPCRALTASGAPRHRAAWERHYRHAHALLFVVDAADHMRLVVAREELQLALSHPELASRRVPLLVFANKSDSAHALPAASVAAALALGAATGPWHVAAGSAQRGDGLQDALAWLAAQLRNTPAPAH